VSLEKADWALLQPFLDLHQSEIEGINGRPAIDTQHPPAGFLQQPGYGVAKT
jgi:hypothetical protein